MLNTINGSIPLMRFVQLSHVWVRMGNGIFPVSTSIYGFLQNFPVYKKAHFAYAVNE